MPANATFIEELKAAARGTVALVMGDRNAPGYFDFSLRGLYGSIIAFLVVLTAQTYLPILLGAGPRPGIITRIVVTDAILLATVIGATAVLLRQIRRTDALMPYLVALSWASSFIGAILIVATLFAIDGTTLLIGIGIVNLVIVINIARLIMTLPPLQIVMLLVAQLVGGVVAIMLIGFLVPLPPEVAAEVAASLSQ